MYYGAPSKMKKLLLGLSLSFFASTAAFAADAVVEEVVPVDVVPGFTWTGGYLGGFAGYAWQDFKYDDEKADEGGFLGGVYVGYNYQFTNNVVLGVEADVGMGGLDFDPSDLDFNSYTALDVRAAGNLRARLGYAMDRALFYVAGGAAIASVKLDDTDSGWSDDTNTYVGWTIGAGVDYAITDNLIFRGEYLYADYGSKDFDIDYNGAPSYTSTVDLKSSTVRLGLAWKF